MKLAIKILTLLAALAFFSAFGACNNGDPKDDMGVASDKISEVEKLTKPFDNKQLIDPGVSSENTFLALKLYLLDGKIVADSSKGQVVAGKFNRGVPRGDFRIAYMDAAGKELGATYVENIFKVRVCDDKGQVGVVKVAKGWTEIFIPNNPAIVSLAFYEGQEPTQRLDLGLVYRKMQDDPNKKRE